MDTKLTRNKNMDKKSIWTIPLTGEKKRRMWSGECTEISERKECNVLLRGNKKTPPYGVDKTKGKVVTSALKMLNKTV